MSLEAQLEQARKKAEIETLNAGDAKAATEFAQRISLPPLELSADMRTLLDPFNKWASQRHARRCPARPATVALFALSQNDMGVAIDTIMAQLSAIEAMHDKFSLPNPVRTAAVRYALETIIKIEPPRSWPKAERAMFALLPPDIRRVIALRQEQADREIRKMHSKVARQLEELRQGIEPDKSVSNESKDVENETQISE